WRSARTAREVTCRDPGPAAPVPRSPAWRPAQPRAAPDRQAAGARTERQEPRPGPASGSGRGGASADTGAWDARVTRQPLLRALASLLRTRASGVVVLSHCVTHCAGLTHQVPIAGTCVPALGHRSLQIYLGEVERRIGDHVHAGQLLVV